MRFSTSDKSENKLGLPSVSQSAVQIIQLKKLSTF